MPGRQQFAPKPFAGKVFYLDLPSNRRAEALESDIKLLGGIVEKFFSKEIRYLVSNKREAKYVKCFRRELATPSPDSGQSSGRKSVSHGQPVVRSRGKSLVGRVVQEQDGIQMDKTLSKALEWGVKILFFDDVITYVEKRKKLIVPNQPVTSAPVKKRAKPVSKPRPDFPKSQAERIKAPFIKVEDASRNYQPIYAAMCKIPEINMATAPPCTPFCVHEKDQKKNGCNSVERGPSRAKMNPDKKLVGFCECCMVQYDNLIKHVQSVRHLAFAKGNDYLVLDRLVSTMQWDFALFKNKTKRPKCSVSSILAVPEPYGTALHKPRDTSVTRKRRTPYSISTAAGGRQPTSGLSMEPIIGSVKCSTKSNLKNQTSAQPVPNRTCRTDSVSDQTAHTGELVQMPTLQVELAPSLGNFSVLDSARLSSRPRTRATSQYLKEDSPGGCSSRVFEITWDSPSECHQNAPLSQEKKTLIPECRGVNLHDQSLSRVRTIQRKVKDQKQKRRKLDTGSAVLNQVRSAGDIPDVNRVSGSSFTQPTT